MVLRKQSRNGLWLIPLLWLVFWLGARGLTTNAIWLDETWSIYNAGGAHYGPLSPFEIIQRVTTQDPRNAAPVYHLLLAGWGGLVGWTAFAARASSLLYGALALAWTYRLGRDMVSPLAGFSAALILGTSALFVYFQHELRVYMLATLFVPCAVWCYWRLLHARQPSRWLQLGFVLSLLGLLYTHYLTGVALVGIASYHLLFAPRQSRWRRIFLLMILAGGLFIPWLGTLSAGMQLNASEADYLRKNAFAPGALLEWLAYFLSNGTPLLLGLSALLSVIGAWRRRQAAVWWFALVGIVGVAAANAAFAIILPGRERYLLMIWPLLALVLGTGAAYLAQTRLRLLTPILLGIWLMVGLQANLNGDLTHNIDGAQALPWDRLAKTLAADAQAGDAAAVHITTFNWVLEVQTAAYHLHGLPIKFTLMESLPDKNFPEAVRQFAGDAGQVWVGLDKRLPAGTRLDDFAAALKGAYAHCGTVFDSPRLQLDLYKRLPSSAFDPAAAPIMRFGEGIALTYVHLAPVQANQPLNILLAWSLDDTVPRGTYSVALHLLDSKGQLMAQSDYGLPDDGVSCRQTTIPLDKLPAGSYQLAAIVYNWSTGERLPGVVTASDTRGERLPLGRVVVP
jgi:4-amino-4-deoxy-L-arabinose transferase-like glycosyltransferase